MSNSSQKLSKTLLKYKTPKQMDEFLDFALTKKEISVIYKRLQILSMLEQGISQREIAQKLGVGIATVTHGSRELSSKKENSSVWRDFKGWRLS